MPQNAYLFQVELRFANDLINVDIEDLGVVLPIEMLYISYKALAYKKTPIVVTFHSEWH